MNKKGSVELFDGVKINFFSLRCVKNNEFFFVIRNYFISEKKKKRTVVSSSAQVNVRISKGRNSYPQSRKRMSPWVLFLDRDITLGSRNLKFITFAKIKSPAKFFFPFCIYFTAAKWKWEKKKKKRNQNMNHNKNAIWEIAFSVYGRLNFPNQIIFDEVLLRISFFFSHVNIHNDSSIFFLSSPPS